MGSSDRTLSEQHSRLQTLFNTSPDATILHDAQGTVYDVNEQTIENLGYTREQLLSMKISEIAVEYDQAELTLLWAGIDDGERETIEGRHRRADGSTFPVEVSIRKIDVDGEERFLTLSRDITERKECERELERYETLVEATADPMYMLDDEGHITYVNEAFVETTGYSEATLLGEHISTAVEEDHIGRGEQLIESLLASGERQGMFEVEVVTAVGDRISTENHLSLLYSDGEFHGTVGVLRDITERKSRQRELERHEAYLEQSRDIITIVGDDGTVQFQSASTEQTTGFSPNQVMGQDGFEHVHPEDREKVTSLFTTFVAESEPEGTVELRVETADGAWRWIEARGVNKLDDPLIEGIIVNSRDITERKEREQKLKQYEALVESAADVFWLFDTDFSENLIINGAYEDVLGQPPTALDEDATAFLEAFHPDDRERLRQAMERLQNDESIDLELKANPRKDFGRWLWVKGNPVYEDEKTLGFAGFVRDITERKDRERQLQREHDKLDEFTSVVSHDLRNPLNVADGQLALAMEDCDSEHLDVVVQALNRMDALIDDVLSLARAGESVGETEPVELAELVETCWRTVETASAALVVETETTMQADATRLQQLLENLVRNAVEHGGEDVTITIGDLPDGFYVEDDGAGIPEDERGMVFDAGYSTAADGTGLGLRIVREVAETHGWEISVTESSDGGARFEIIGVSMEG